MWDIMKGGSNYFTRDMKRMILKMRLMMRIKQGRAYSYGIVKEFGKGGFAKLMGKSLKNDIYNTIKSLEIGGYIKETSTIEKGKAKKYYSLTVRGEDIMKSAAKLHKEMLRELSKLFR